MDECATIKAKEEVSTLKHFAFMWNHHTKSVFMALKMLHLVASEIYLK